MNKIITVDLPKAKNYGAVELTELIKKHTMRGVLAALGLTIALFLFVLISAALQYQVYFAPITSINSVDISTITSNDQDVDETDLNAPPPEVIINTGPASRAGNPVAAPDAEITPDMQDFSAMDEIDRASSEGGDGDDLGGFADNIDMNDVKVDEAIEEDPAWDEFKPVEKEPDISSMQDLMNLVVYPESAKRVGIEGTVVVTVLITEKGTPKNIRVLSSDNSNLNNAAKSAVMKYRGYKPAIQNGSPTSCWLVIPINFKLK